MLSHSSKEMTCRVDEGVPLREIPVCEEEAVNVVRFRFEVLIGGLRTLIAGV